MTYATVQHFINEVQQLAAEDKIRVINILLNSFKPTPKKNERQRGYVIVRAFHRAA